MNEENLSTINQEVADKQSPPLYDQVHTGFVGTTELPKDIKNATN